MDSDIFKFLAAFCDTRVHPVHGCEYVTYSRGYWYATDSFMIVELDDSSDFDDGMALPYWWAKSLKPATPMEFDGIQWECGPMHLEKFVNKTACNGMKTFDYRSLMSFHADYGDAMLDAKRARKFFAALAKIDGMHVSISDRAIHVTGIFKKHPVRAKLMQVRA